MAELPPPYDAAGGGAMSGLLLAAVAALCWGVAPVFGKLGLRNISVFDGLAARYIVTMVFVLAWIIAAGRTGHIRRIAGDAWIFLGFEALLATLAGDLAYFAALKFGSATGTALILAASPLFTIWLGNAVFQERLSFPALIGGVLVMIGVALIGIGELRR